MIMTQEEKDLLLKDLCARLPYGVIVKDRNGVHKLTAGNTEFTDLLYNGKCNIKPYLFPLSSMTEEQESWLYFNSNFTISQFGGLIVRCDADYHYLYTDIYHYIELIDWLNKNHFNYRGLIEKSLAIDATNLGIYK